MILIIQAPYKNKEMVLSNGVESHTSCQTQIFTPLICMKLCPATLRTQYVSSKDTQGRVCLNLKIRGSFSKDVQWDYFYWGHIVGITYY